MRACSKITRPQPNVLISKQALFTYKSKSTNKLSVLEATQTILAELRPIQSMAEWYTNNEISKSRIGLKLDIQKYQKLLCKD